MTQSTEEIPYYPNREQYEAGSRCCLQKTYVEGSLPYGFPEKMDSNMVWEGRDITLTHTGEEIPYLVILDHSQLEEIDEALKYFQSMSSRPRCPWLLHLTTDIICCSLGSANRNTGSINFPLTVFTLCSPISI